MADVYVTAEELREWRRVTPEEFHLEDEEGGASAEEQLDELLTRWSEHVKTLIDEHYRPARDFLDEADGDLEQVPGSVRSVALRALSNYVTMAQNARESSFVRLDEFRVRVDMHDAILTRGMRRELPAPKGRRILGGFVSRDGDDGDDDE
ncbi:MAG: hypothetical protein ACODAF_01535 [Actinomycetota bacterium]